MTAPLLARPRNPAPHPQMEHPKTRAIKIRCLLFGTYPALAGESARTAPSAALRRVLQTLAWSIDELAAGGTGATARFGLGPGRLRSLVGLNPSER